MKNSTCTYSNKIPTSGIRASGDHTSGGPLVQYAQYSSFDYEASLNIGLVVLRD